MSLWQEIREDAYMYMKNKKESPIKKFMKEELGFQDNILYEYKNNYRLLIIHSKHPGVWIGVAGSRVEKLKEILKKEWENDVEVNFIEIKGDFLMGE